MIHKNKLLLPLHSKNGYDPFQESKFTFQRQQLIKWRLNVEIVSHDSLCQNRFRNVVSHNVVQLLETALKSRCKPM